MGSFANTLFQIMLGWLQGAVSAVWSAFTNENGQSMFNWIGRYWVIIAGILCAVGLAADLCVYLFRWKPFRVWKSFFFHKQDEDEPEEEKPALQRAPAQHRRPVTRTETSMDSRTGKYDHREEPDLSQWTKEDTSQKGTAEETRQPAVVTNAGYIVPADSPYRKPGLQTEKASIIRNRPEKIEENIFQSDRKQQPMTLQPRRRRRLNVSELFGDPMEEIQEFDAPQSIIDRRKAYHEPVYPHGWKQSEGRRE